MWMNCDEADADVVVDVDVDTYQDQSIPIPSMFNEDNWCGWLFGYFLYLYLVDGISKYKFLPGKTEIGRPTQ